MAPDMENVIDLHAPVTADIVLEVRRGKMKNMKGLKVKSGIDKTVCDGPVKVSLGGIDEDEHDYTFHGGPDKALHGYCCTHYASWQSEFPSAAARFRPGGFGENLVLARMNERNVCIGDVVSVGPEVVLQVSLPRQPCFKLNHRFEIRNFAPNTWRFSRTGWYYRVLREGTLQAGHEVRLVERPHPRWTLERVQEYLHRSPDNMAMVEELAAIDEFGAECQRIFKARIAKHQARERKALLAQKEMKAWRDFRLVERKKETPRVVSLVFEAVEPLSGADRLDPGAHVKLKLHVANTERRSAKNRDSGGGGGGGGGGGDGISLDRAYSVVDGDRNRFRLGVSLEESSRGGSMYLHETLAVGDTVQVGRFTSAVPLVESASHHVFVAAGIGLTAFLAMIEVMASINYSYVLHYAVRSADEVPFRERLERLGDNVVLYDGSTGSRMDIAAIVSRMSFNSRINFCGPRRMMDEALGVIKAAKIDEGDVHFEAFGADTSGDPFEAVVANRGGVALTVGSDETLLEVLQRSFGDDISSSCGVGNCGTCKLAVRDGRVEHRGTGLPDADKADAMLSCVSRGIGRITIEI